MQTMPNSELVRVITYLAGFVLGAAAFALGIYVLVAIPERSEVATLLIGLGLAMMGMGGLATYNVPSVKPTKSLSSVMPLPAIATNTELVDRALTGETETVVVDPLEYTQNAESERRGDIGVVYAPKRGKHE